MHIMRLLEDLPQLEDSFEMVLSRKVSVNTEFDEPNNKNSSGHDYDNDLLDQLPERVRVSPNFLTVPFAIFNNYP